MDFFKWNKEGIIFFDFDGVIKDSVEVKSSAFEQLFLPFGNEVATKVRDHHEANGGMSRYEKIPVYLCWAEKDPSESIVQEYSRRFSQLVKQRVIDSVWVPGILEFLKMQQGKRKLFIVTATPQAEIEEILLALDISHYFEEVYGTPTEKIDAIRILLNKYSVPLERSVMIGDSSSDYHAAMINKVPFILRRTKLNRELQEKIVCEMIDNFTTYIK